MNGSDYAPNNLAPNLEPDCFDDYDPPEDEWYHDCGEDTCCCADPIDNRVSCGNCRGPHTMDVCPHGGRA